MTHVCDWIQDPICYTTDDRRVQQCSKKLETSIVDTIPNVWCAVWGAKATRVALSTAIGSRFHTSCFPVAAASASASVSVSVSAGVSANAG